jgi:pimeloyl-ACP methyl ester carboxylesterase
MSAKPPSAERTQTARPDKSGEPTFEWKLTDSSITDTVRLIAGPFDVLPIVFVPGIMGSNLKSTTDGTPIWRLDTGVGGKPWGMLKAFANLGPGPRQRLLHPERCVVDSGGAIPSKLGGSVHSKEEYRRRGWGSVGQGSYHEFLLWLEAELNPAVRDPAMWLDYYEDQAAVSAAPKPNDQPKLHPGVRMGMKGQPFSAEKPFTPVMTDDLLARSKFLMPVHVVGYNWLASNKAAAELLQKRVLEIIKENDVGSYRCEQVIIVTHSMGGLVARACAQLGGMGARIAGIVHGVMPAVGAAVAYRRCKIGMRDEDFGAGLVIGSNGQEVTAVFAQAPGALQLLPSQTYSANWLRVQGPDGKTVESWPIAGAAGNDPYEAIYKRRDRWWGLVNEAWLSPVEGQPIKWETFQRNVDIAAQFHAELGASYHPNTFVFYGADPKQKSFEKVTWKIAVGLAPDRLSPPSIPTVVKLNSQQVRMDGTSPEYVGGETQLKSSTSDVGGEGSMYDTSYWELHCEKQDGAGDGTVPISSGAAPLVQGGSSVQQQFKLTGFGHEPAFNDGTAQRATLYAITKIAGKAKRPQ